MTTNAIRITLMLSTVAVLGACAAGTGGGGNDDRRGGGGEDDRDPVMNFSTAEIEETTGVGADPEDLSSAVGSTVDSATRADGQIAFDRDVQANFDLNRDGELTQNEDTAISQFLNEFDDPKESDIPRDVRQTEFEAGDSVIVRTLDASGPPRDAIVYLPAPGSDIAAGMIARNDPFQGNYGIFGRETESVVGLEGSATYTGRSHATIAGYDRDGASYDGQYTGAARGEVDFDNRTVRIDSDMTSESEFGDPVSVRLVGEIADDGEISGTSRYVGVIVDGETVTGDFEGDVFGENGQTVGGTYQASEFVEEYVQETEPEIRERYFSDEVNASGGVIVHRED